MKRQWWLGALALVAAGCGGDGNGSGGSSPIASAAVAGVTANGQLVFFDTNEPDAITQSYNITGLPGGDPVASLDYRPANPGVLYVVTESGALFTVEPNNEDSSVAVTSVGSIAVPDSGDDVVEVDFNPVADRLRVATDDERSLRVDPTNASTTVDSNFTYGDSSDVDIEGVAYTNSFETATTTALYAIESEQNALVLVNPPNSGTLTVVGSLEVNIDGPTPFDISPADPTLGFFAQDSGNRSRIYSVDIGDGSTVRGRETPSGIQLVGLTVLPQS